MAIGARRPPRAIARRARWIAAGATAVAPPRAASLLTGLSLAGALHRGRASEPDGPPRPRPTRRSPRRRRRPRREGGRSARSVRGHHPRGGPEVRSRRGPRPRRRADGVELQPAGQVARREPEGLMQLMPRLSQGAGDHESLRSPGERLRRHEVPEQAARPSRREREARPGQLQRRPRERAALPRHPARSRRRAATSRRSPASWPTPARAAPTRAGAPGTDGGGGLAPSAAGRPGWPRSRPARPAAPAWGRAGGIRHAGCGGGPPCARTR